MRVQFVFKNTFLLILFLVFFYNCAERASLLKKQSKDLSVLIANQPQSVKLKRTCEPVAFLHNVNTDTALKQAFQHKANSIQIFERYYTGGFLFLFEEKYDLRLWHCSTGDKPVKKIQLTAAAKEKGKKMAQVLFIDFINTNEAENFQWVSKSIPECIDSAMKNNFEYILFSDEEKRNAIVSKIQSDTELNTESIKKISENTEADVIVFGAYTIDENNNIKIKSRVYYKKAEKIIGEAEEGSSADIQLFFATEKLAKNIVDQIYKYELK